MALGVENAEQVAINNCMTQCLGLALCLSCREQMRKAVFHVFNLNCFHFSLCTDYISFSAHTDFEQTSEFIRILKPPHIVSTLDVSFS